ncbi:hypothetical protein [Thalassobacillus sp. C254]|uniref:hypothetical protein n=1 Tax=Thalassobacillus sp. C254 TaxID=1225341 RepID=UPI0006D02077|nr:hypothetical protein [Thalassobacillus sp. C254]
MNGRKEGVYVNAVVLVYMATDINQALIEDEQRSKEILNRIPADRKIQRILQVLWYFLKRELLIIFMGKPSW